MNSETFELVRASKALGISATYVSQAEEAAKSFENRVKHLIQQVINCEVDEMGHVVQSCFIVRPRIYVHFGCIINKVY